MSSTPNPNPEFNPLTPQAAQSMNDIFGVNNTSEDILNEFAGPEPEAVKEVEKPKPTFQPKLTKAQQEKLEAEKTKPTEISDIPEDQVTPARLKALEDMIRNIAKGVNGVKLGKVPEKPEPLDFTKISENDVYDLDIPIEAIDHGVPDYLNVELKDKNYVARWIHKTARRLGPMMAVGWTYIEKNDLDENCHLEVTQDENGHFRYDDVILMKLPKQKYFGQLRKNYERAVAQVNPKKHHELAKTAVERALMSPENTGLNVATGKRDTSTSGDFRKYSGKNKLEVYIPGE